MKKEIKKEIKKPSDLGGDFEVWFRRSLPWQLNLSQSKQVAVDEAFYQFATFARTLERKAPEEFEIFFNELERRMAKVSKWRAPKGTKVVPIYYKGKAETHPNGKIIYHLVEKPLKK